MATGFWKHPCQGLLVPLHKAPHTQPQGPPSTGQPKPGGLVSASPFSSRPQSLLCNRDQRVSTACFSANAPTTPATHEHLSSTHRGLTCVGTISQSCTGDGVPAAWRPPLSAGWARAPGSQSLGYAGLAKGHPALRAGAPELPGSAAAIATGKPSPGIRGGLLWGPSPFSGLPGCSFPSGRRQGGHPAGRQTTLGWGGLTPP